MVYLLAVWLARFYRVVEPRITRMTRMKKKWASLIPLPIRDIRVIRGKFQGIGSLSLYARGNPKRLLRTQVVDFDQANASAVA
jgi:hypothetical protein